MLNINGIEWLHKVGCYHTTLERDPLLVLEFCRKGQISWAGGALPCNQLKAGEMLVYDAWTSGALTRSADYCGDRILFFEESIKYIREHFAGFLIDIKMLAQKMCRPGRPFIVHTKEEVASAFEKIDNKSKNLQAASITGRSEVLPMIILTNACMSFIFGLISECKNTKIFHLFYPLFCLWEFLFFLYLCALKNKRDKYE